MKFFNSVTGKVEDDGKDLPEMDMINIPAGRMASPDGSQDVNIPVYADLLKRERQNSNQIELGMLQNPESNEFVNSLFTQGSNTIRPADASQKQEMNPLVKAELMKKYNIQDKSQGSERMPTGSIAPKDDSVPPVLAAQKAPSVLDQFSPEKYQEALQQMKERQSGTALAQFASSVGDALARRDSSGTDKYFQDLRNNIQDQTTGEFGRQKASAIGDIKTKQELAKIDPNSQESQNFRKLVQSTMPNIARQYGESFNLVTAADKDSILDFGKMREMIDARKQQSAMQNSLKNEAKTDKKMTMMNEIEDRRQNINANLAQLRSMIGEDGTWEAFGSHNQDMDRLVEQVATDMAKLMDPSSVARPSEVEAVKKTLVKPGFSNRNSTAVDVLNNFENEVERRASSAYSIRGLDAPKGRPSAEASESKSSSKPKWAK